MLLPFFCLELNKLVCDLDQRARSSAATHSFLRKERVSKSPTSILPPADAPKWALKSAAVQEEAVTTRPAADPVATKRLNTAAEESNSSDFSFDS